MKKALFDELVASIREAGRMLRATKQQPARPTKPRRKKRTTRKKKV